MLALCAVLALAVSQPVWGASLEELAGSERAAILRAAQGGAIIEAQLRNPSPRLMPSHGELQRLIAETTDSLGPNIFVEALSLYHKPPARPPAAWSDAERTGLFNQVVALSSLAGIEYFSESRQAMRTLYESSHVVDGPSGRTPLPDPVFAAIPPALALHARQRDLTFGDNVYRFDYRAGADAIFFTQENITSMNVGIIPAVGRNRFRTVMAVIDTGDSLLIYAAAMARAVSLPWMGDRISSSFANRVEAILQWFNGRANGVFGRDHVN